MIEDRVLVWRFNRGDPAALCRIYEKYRDGLLKVAAVLLNDRSSVEDVLHDVFVDFAQTTGRFRLQGRLPFREIAKLKEISINTAQSRYRYGLHKLRSTLNGELIP